MTFRSMICSLDLFMLDVDTNIIDSISEHYLLKSLISTVAIFSFLCTVLLLLSLISERLKAYIALRNLKITQERNHLYLFFGANEPSKLLAKEFIDMIPMLSSLLSPNHKIMMMQTTHQMYGVASLNYSHIAVKLLR